jgi:hypothetical protein
MSERGTPDPPAVSMRASAPRGAVGAQTRLLDSEAMARLDGIGTPRHER